MPGKFFMGRRSRGFENRKVKNFVSGIVVMQKRLFLSGLLVLLANACCLKQEGSRDNKEQRLVVGEKGFPNTTGKNENMVVEVQPEVGKNPCDSETEKRLRAVGLVDIVEIDSSIAISMVYATSSNFTGEVLYSDLRKAFLLPEAAKRLITAQKLLKVEKPDWSLIVYDAARPMEAQQKMWEKVRGTDKQVYVSNPANGGGLHNYGAAVDVALVDMNGRMIEMGSPFDFFGDEARPDREEEMFQQGRITGIALKNRRLLRRVMKKAGFRPLHSEWWHFNLMSREEAKLRLKVIP